MCPGYRNELDLAFRDETEHVQKKCSRPQRPASLTEPGYNTPVRLASQMTLVESVADVSLAYFYHHHIIHPAQGPIYSVALLASMKALGAASCSNSASGSQYMSLQATQQYIDAVCLLNNALCSQQTVTLDSTLLSVLILGYFEMTAGNRQISIQQWAKHVKGTVALLQLRGPAQMKTADGRLLFLQAAALVLIECSSTATRIPPIVYAMIDEHPSYANDPSQLLWTTLAVHMKILDLYSDVVHCNATDPMIIVKEALQLDYTLSQIFYNASSEWSYEVSTSKEYNQFPSCCPYVHIYKSPLSAQTWNAMRNGRIMLHWIIIKTLNRHDVHKYDFLSMEQLALISETSVQLQIDMLATVQQYLGVRPLKEDGTIGFSFPTKRAESRMWRSSEAVIPDIGQHRLPVLRTTGGHNLLWHLAIIVGKGSPALRPSAREMIQAVGATLGIQQAFALLEAMEEDDQEL